MGCFKIKMSQEEDFLLERVIDDNQPDELRKLLTSQNVNRKFSHTKLTPLRNAVRMGVTECVQVCLEYGAHVNEPNEHVSVLQMSVIFHNIRHTPLDIMMLLLEAGADVNHVSQNWKGHKTSVLDFADLENQPEMAWILIDYGAMHYSRAKYSPEVIPYRNHVRQRSLLACALRPNWIAMDRNIMRLIGKQIWSMRRS